MKQFCFVLLINFSTESLKVSQYFIFISWHVKIKGYFLSLMKQQIGIISYLENYLANLIIQDSILKNRYLQYFLAFIINPIRSINSSKLQRRFKNKKFIQQREITLNLIPKIMQTQGYLKYFRNKNVKTKPNQQLFSNTQEQCEGQLETQKSPLFNQPKKQNKQQQIQISEQQEVRNYQQKYFKQNFKHQNLKDKADKNDFKQEDLMKIKQDKLPEINQQSNRLQNYKQSDKFKEKNNQYFDSIPNRHNNKEQKLNKSLKLKSSQKFKDIKKQQLMKGYSLHNPLSLQRNDNIQLNNRGSGLINNRIKTVQSLSMHSTQQKFFVHPIRPYDRNKTAHNKKFRTLKTTFADLNSSCKNYNDEYTMSLQNQRMGWRIVNAKSMIEQYLNSSYYTYHMYNGNLINRDKYKGKQTKDRKKTTNLKQINNVFKVFFKQNKLKNIDLLKNKNLFRDLKNDNQAQQYILKQNQSEEHNYANNKSTCTKNQNAYAQIQTQFHHKLQFENQSTNFSHQNKQNSFYNEDHSFNSQRIKPSFFRSTYRKTDKSVNLKPCEEQKIKISKLKSNKRYEYLRNKNKINHLQTQPGNLSDQPQTFGSLQNHVFGKGSTIIQLRNFQIETHPAIKDNQIMMLQLIQKHYSDKKTQIKNSFIGTPPFQYKQLKKGVKLAINLKSGDFVPLKIWKYHGLNLIEIGILDLNLMIFKDRKKHCHFNSNEWINDKQNFQNINSHRSNQNQKIQGIKKVHLYKQQRHKNIQCQKSQQRQILYFQGTQKLRKNKKFQIQATVRFDCMIYNKKFNKIKKINADGQINDFNQKTRIYQQEQSFYDNHV